MNPFEYTQVNIREQGSWAHSNDRAGATEKAIGLAKVGHCQDPAIGAPPAHHGRNDTQGACHRGRDRRPAGGARPGGHRPRRSTGGAEQLLGLGGWPRRIRRTKTSSTAICSVKQQNTQRRIVNRLTLEREMACDDIVLAQTASPRAYASSLISFVEKLQNARGLALAQALVSRMRHMSLRVVANPRCKTAKPHRALEAGFGVERGPVCARLWRCSLRAAVGDVPESAEPESNAADSS